MYGTKECLNSNMLCGFVTVNKASSFTADLLLKLLALMHLQHLLVNYPFESWDHPFSKNSCRNDANHNVLEKLDVSWYQRDILLRLAELFTFPLSLQAILMNLMCVDQRRSETAETVKILGSSFFLPPLGSDRHVVSLCAHTACMRTGDTTCFFKSISMVLTNTLESEVKKTRTSTEMCEGWQISIFEDLQYAYTDIS